MEIHIFVFALRAHELSWIVFYVLGLDRSISNVKPRLEDGESQQMHVGGPQLHE